MAYERNPVFTVINGIIITEDYASRNLEQETGKGLIWFRSYVQMKIQV